MKIKDKITKAKSPKAKVDKRFVLPHAESEEENMIEEEEALQNQSEQMEVEDKNAKSPKSAKVDERFVLPQPESDEGEDSENEAAASAEATQSEQMAITGDSNVQGASEEDDVSALKQQSDTDDDEMDLGSLMKTTQKKRRKKGIIYVSNIPKHMNVTRIREILGEYGKIGRVYLQPEKLPGGGAAAADKKKKKHKRLARHFTEGWLEFESKRVAKQLVLMLNNKQISSRKKSQFFDHLWSMKYLPRFKWTHLTERMNYEQAVHKQRLTTEVSQARKETTFFQNNLDRSEYIKKKEKKMNKKATVATKEESA